MNSPERHQQPLVFATPDFTALRAHSEAQALGVLAGQVATGDVQYDTIAGATTGVPRRHEQLVEEVRQMIADKPLVRSEEDGHNDDWTEDQEYSHSTRLIGIVGRLMLEGKLDTPEGRIAKESLRDRFISSVIEMLHTNEKTREVCEISRERTHIVRANNRVMALDGKTWMVGMCERGARKAAAQAKTEPAMEAPAARCGADARVSKRVEQLGVGDTMYGLSVFPIEAMQKYGKEFYEHLGFREGLIFLQWYHRLDEHTLLSATYSLDHTNIEMLKEVWAEFGGRIPDGEVTDTWLDHDITMHGTIEEARAKANAIRDRFYEKLGVTTRRYSVDQFMEINQHIADEMFDSLYLNMAVAHETHRKDPVLQVFIDSMLAGKEHLNPRIQNQLLSMSQSSTLQRKDIALLEQLIRYATTERLRDGLDLLGRTAVPRVETATAPAGMSQAQFIAQLSAIGVIDGAAHNRTYGGCTISIDLGTGVNPDGTLKLNSALKRPQDAYGGLDEGEGATKEKMRWTRGVCRIDNCPTRPSATMVGPCSVCWNCQCKYDAGMDLEQIMAAYGKRAKEKAKEKVRQHASEVFRPFLGWLIGKKTVENS